MHPIERVRERKFLALCVLFIYTGPRLKNCPQSFTCYFSDTFSASGLFIIIYKRRRGAPFTKYRPNSFVQLHFLANWVFRSSLNCLVELILLIMQIWTFSYFALRYQFRQCLVCKPIAELVENIILVHNIVRNNDGLLCTSTQLEIY